MAKGYASKLTSSLYESSFINENVDEHEDIEEPKIYNSIKYACKTTTTLSTIKDTLFSVTL